MIQDITIIGTDTSSTIFEIGFLRNAEKFKSTKKSSREVRHVFESRGYIDEMTLKELKFLKAVIKETLRFHPLALYYF
jgi:hypothetical protein